MLSLENCLINQVANSTDLEILGLRRTQNFGMYSYLFLYLIIIDKADCIMN